MTEKTSTTKAGKASASRTATVTAFLCAALLSAMASVPAYFKSLSAYAVYDDEGAMILSLKRFFAGRVLYDQVYTIYGPVYYFYQWLAHHLAGAPVTNDSVRILTITFWVATATAGFFVVYAFTRSIALAILAHATVFVSLSFLGVEPAHPQEACILLLVVLPLCGCVRNQRWSLALLGAVVGGIAMTKINLGACAALGIAIPAAAVMDQRWRRILFVPVCAAGLAFPVILMRSRFGEGWAVRFCAVEVCSIAAIAVAMAGLRWRGRLPVAQLVFPIAGVLAAVILISSFVFARGTTPLAMVQWLVIWPATKFLSTRSAPMDLPGSSLLFAVTGILGALVLARKERTRRVQVLIAGLKMFFGAGMLACFLTFNYKSVDGFGLAFLWMVVLPTLPDEDDARIFPRAVLASVAALQVLYAYPVAGAQAIFTAVPVLLSAFVALGDGIDALRVSNRVDEKPRRELLPALAALVLCALLYQTMGQQAKASYARLTPLNLPGARKIHVEPAFAAALRDITAHAQSCTTLLTAPGMYSFNFWTGARAPEQMYAGPWMLFMSDAEQETVLADLLRDRGSCVLYNRQLVGFWTAGSNVPPGPLLRSVQEKFQITFSAAGYELKTPK